MARDSETTPPGFLEPTFGQRFLARLIDGIVLLPVGLIALVATEGSWQTALPLVVAAGYEITLVVRGGQTIGKIAMRIRVVDRTTGSIPDTAHAVGRTFVLMAGSLMALIVPALTPAEIAYTIIVLLPILRPPLHLGLHDIGSGTVVTATMPSSDRTI